jgi:hypothetical protein
MGILASPQGSAGKIRGRMTVRHVILGHPVAGEMVHE